MSHEPVDENTCIALWRGVLLQAFHDVFCAAGGTSSATGEWFTKTNEDFEEVCFLADVDPNFVRARFHRLYRGDDIIDLGGLRSTTFDDQVRRSKRDKPC